jgi:hypothetical protein
MVTFYQIGGLPMREHGDNKHTELSSGEISVSLPFDNGCRHTVYEFIKLLDKWRKDAQVIQEMADQTKESGHENS